MGTLTFFVFCISLGWYLFFENNVAGSSEKMIAAVLSFLGIVFGMTQFFITQINIRKKKFFDLRYSAYKEIVVKVESISQMVIEVMVSGENNEPHGLVSKLMNSGNEFMLLNRLNTEYLFPGLTKKNSAIQVNSTLKQLLIRTDEFRKCVERVIINEENFKDDPVYIIEKMNWNNDMNGILRSLHQSRYQYYKDLRVYL
ncbi:hypothetical protein Q3A66_20565 [Hymenobacter sp. BT770]|uniref:hypothetical protein n=1 Tax=Hymenobacter sp. BT770 TaxID=2886942 RepID=UPI001D110319|nr:hypothetical protein [Hymenobacter sp. BT770]MCC3155461.1 hypothetical protein [Hymenobacter sp. BT770]MDO3417468.1 hypothetical protein [Hymenobacter sp. BT770]